MTQFITNYDRKVNELKRDGIVLPETVLALQLLESVYLEKERKTVSVNSYRLFTERNNI